MISFTERTILDRRTLGRICDHGTTECKDIITLCENNRGYCSVYVCNKGLQEILRLSAQNDGKTMHNDQNGLVVMFSRAKHHKAQETKPNRCRNMIQTMHNDQNGLVVMFSRAKHHKAQETKPDRCRNMIRKEVA